MTDQFHVLLVEDDDIDAEAVTRAMDTVEMTNPVHRVEYAEHALDKLRGIGTEPLPRPFLILLDINLPGMSGFEMLDELRNDPELRGSIVYMMSTSTVPEDRKAAYDRCVAGYVRKDRGSKDYETFATLLNSYNTAIDFHW